MEHSQDMDNLFSAKKTYQTFITMMNENEWTYQCDDDDLTFCIMSRGEVLPIKLKVSVEASYGLVLLFSTLDFNIPLERINEGALAICAINDSLIDGSFDYNIETGEICFRMTMTFRESILSAKACEYFLCCALHFVNKFSIRLLGIAQGTLSAPELCKMICDEEE